jgi:hypothetical protein
MHTRNAYAILFFLSCSFIFYLYYSLLRGFF